MHRHCAALEDCGGLEDCGLHALHATLFPAVGLYVPATHALHPPAAASPVYPGAHTHCLAARSGTCPSPAHITHCDARLVALTT